MVEQKQAGTAILVANGSKSAQEHVFTAYVMDDPTGKLPDEITLAVSRQGLFLTCPRTQTALGAFAWSTVSDWMSRVADQPALCDMFCFVVAPLVGQHIVTS